MSLRKHVTIFSSTTLLMLGLYAAFVGFFFFTYGSYIENKVIDDQINTLTDNFTDDFVFFASKSKNGQKFINEIRNNIKNINPPDLSKQDQQVAKNNSNLINNAIISLSLTLLIFVILSVLVWFYGLTQKEKIVDTYGHIIQRIVLLMIIVMLLEFLFFTLVAGNYTPVDPNVVKTYLVESLQNYANRK